MYFLNHNACFSRIRHNSYKMGKHAASIRDNNLSEITISFMKILRMVLTSKKGAVSERKTIMPEFFEGN